MKTKIVCGGCGKKYAIDTEKIPSGGATIKCPSCNAKIVLKREEPLSANDIIFDKADQSVAIKKEPIADRRKEVSVDSEMKADQREKDVEKKMGDHTKGGAEKLNDKAQKTALAAKGVKSVIKNRLLFLGVGIVVVLLIVILALFGGGESQPPDAFLSLNLRAVYGGMADGGTQPLGVTLADFLLSLNKDAEKNWESNGDQWLLKMISEDKATGRTNKIVFVFNLWRDEFFKGDVILERLVVNGHDLQQSQIFNSVIDLTATAMQMRSSKSIGEALSKNDLNSFKKILKEDKDISTEEKEECYFDAVQSGRVDFLIELIEHHIDINAKNYQDKSAIELAVSKKQESVVKLLLDKKINSESVNRALLLAAREGFAKIVEIMVENGADINFKDGTGRTALISALSGKSEDHKQVVAYLLNRNADTIVKEKNKIKYSALHVALRNSYDESRRSMDAEYVKLILKKGIDFNSEDNFGDDLFYHVVLINDPEIVRLLIDNNYDYNPSQEKLEKTGSKSPLITAVEHESMEIIKLLLNKGVDVNTKTTVGNTALIVAAKVGNKAIVDELLEHKADPNIKNNHGDSAMDIAKKEKYTEIVDTLKKHGAIDMMELFADNLSGKFINQTGQKNGILLVKRISGSEIEISLSTSDFRSCDIKNKKVALSWNDYRRQFEGEFEDLVTKNEKTRKANFRIEFGMVNEQDSQYEIEGYCGTGRYFREKMPSP